MQAGDAYWQSQRGAETDPTPGLRGAETDPTQSQRGAEAGPTQSQRGAEAGPTQSQRGAETGPTQSQRAAEGSAVAVPGYQGPPPMTAPPYAWQPERVVEPAPPRRLPAQDHAAIDAEEARARTLTYGVAVLVGALLVIVVCALCGRALF